MAAIVWLVWRSPVRYALKAATLSAGALLATPYAFAYDFAAIAIPVAFLAKDQIELRLAEGEQTTLLALFVAGLFGHCVAGRAPGRCIDFVRAVVADPAPRVLIGSRRLRGSRTVEDHEAERSRL